MHESGTSTTSGSSGWTSTIARVSIIAFCGAQKIRRFHSLLLCNFTPVARQGYECGVPMRASIRRFSTRFRAISAARHGKGGTGLQPAVPTQKQKIGHSLRAVRCRRSRYRIQEAITWPRNTPSSLSGGPPWLVTAAYQDRAGRKSWAGTPRTGGRLRVTEEVWPGYGSQAVLTSRCRKKKKKKKRR